MIMPIVAAMKPFAPLFGTLLAYEAGLRVQRRLGGSPWANPVLIAVAVVAPIVVALGASPADYLAGVQSLTLLLGPATIALALPLCRSLTHIRIILLPVVATVAAATVTSTGAAIAVALVLHAPPAVVHAMATKSVTAAVAIAVAPQIGVDASLAVGITVLSGIFGAILCTTVLDWSGVHDRRARGLAVGAVAHGIGTARMLAIDPVAGAFSGLAMSLSGLAGGVLLPFLFASWAN